MRPPDVEERRPLPESGAPVTTTDVESTPYVETGGALAVRWTIEARCHLLAAARLLELDPARAYQARHLFGIASRLDVAA